MKKTRQTIISILSLIITLTLTGSSFAEDACVIQWWGDKNGLALTNETSMTQQAAAEAFELIHGWSSSSWEDSCYEYSYGEGTHCSFSSAYQSACLDGTWSDGESTCSTYFCPPYSCSSQSSFTGNWDVFCGPDSDEDGVPDSFDNCPDVSSLNQDDCDSDGQGDVCEIDADSDGIPDDCDNCPADSNPDQEDCDSDGQGDVCEIDADSDGIPDDCDNCPIDFNPDQEDCEGDGQGDVCEIDADSDGIPDDCDNCPIDFNPDQEDCEGDGQGDVCEIDADSDGIPDDCDNCPVDSNPGQHDCDNDGLGDECEVDKDLDQDSDGLVNACDNCPDVANPDQEDVDGDGQGKACDTIYNGNFDSDNANDIAVASGYTQITGYLKIYNSSLTTLNGLESLTSVGGDLNLGWNGALTSLTGLESLTSVGGDLRIYSTDGLTSLSALSNLTSLGGGLTLSGNDGLTSLSALSNLTSLGGRLYLWGNDALTSLTGLENITSVGEQLFLSSNGALTSLTGLENLTSVGGYLRLDDNHALTSLTGLENLTSVGGDLRIQSNDVLTDLCGLYNVNLAGNSLSIYENPDLSMGTANALETQLRNNGFTGTADINDNGGSGLVDCGTDTDNDGISSTFDNCPNVANPNQEDADADDTGDPCDADTVYGTVTGAVQADVSVGIYKPSCGGDVLLETTTTDSEGYYGFGGLADGNLFVVPEDETCSFQASLDYIKIPQTVMQSYDFYSVDLWSGLVAYYPFNGSADDETANSNHGTINGPVPAADHSGNLNSAYSFDGVDDYVEIGNDASLDLGTAATIAAWIKPDKYDSSILMKWAWAAEDKVMTLNSTGNINFNLFYINRPPIVSNAIVPLDTWTHVAAYYDGSEVRLYINGVLDVSAAASGDVRDSTNILYIGNKTPGRDEWSDMPFGGAIDEVRIYNRALSVEEITALYNE